MYLLAFAESIQLIPDGTLLVHVALILVMIWVLNRTFFRPVNEIIDKREKNSGGKNGEAETILREVSEKQQRYNQAVLEARSEGYEAIETQRADAVADRQQRITAAKEETARLLADGKKELQDQTAEAKADIVRQAEEMSDRIAANILKA